MKQTNKRLAFLLTLTGSMALLGCASNESVPAPKANANAALSAPYLPGTGISGNSFGRHPRFYSGGATDDQPAGTQPAGR